MGMEILYEDNHCLAVAKPAGVASAHFEGTAETMDHLAKAYLKDKFAKPGKVFLGIVHRLDKPTSGVLLFARTSKAAARLAEQFRTGAVEKVYWAVVDGNPTADAGTLVTWLKKNEQMRRVEITSEGTREAKRAVVHYHVKATHGGLALLELRPQTGRTHQLRVQLAEAKMPIVGDFKYGSEQPFAGGGIALHARSLTFLHPIRNEPITLTAEVPQNWRGRFAHLLRGFQS